MSNNLAYTHEITTNYNKRMKELWDYERYSMPDKEGGVCFYSYNNVLQNQDVIFMQKGLDAESELFYLEII